MAKTEFGPFKNMRLFNSFKWIYLLVLLFVLKMPNASIEIPISITIECKSKWKFEASNAVKLRMIFFYQDEDNLNCLLNLKTFNNIFCMGSQRSFSYKFYGIWIEMEWNGVQISSSWNQMWWHYNRKYVQIEIVTLLQSMLLLESVSNTF